MQKRTKSDQRKPVQLEIKAETTCCMTRVISSRLVTCPKQRCCACGLHMRQMGIEPKATARWRARLVVMVAGETKLAEHGAYIVLLQLRPVLLAHVAE